MPTFWWRVRGTAEGARSEEEEEEEGEDVESPANWAGAFATESS